MRNSHRQSRYASSRRAPQSNKKAIGRTGKLLVLVLCIAFVAVGSYLVMESKEYSPKWHGCNIDDDCMKVLAVCGSGSVNMLYQVQFTAWALKQASMSSCSKPTEEEQKEYASARAVCLQSRCALSFTPIGKE